jgi:heme-degrading monooxygenase HmoA
VISELRAEGRTMSVSTEIPQTLTVMEACFTLNPGVDEEFWPAQEKFGPVAAAASGFLAVIGGPIANSPWLYFSGKWATPAEMDDWQHSRAHIGVQKRAHDKWFKSVYLRKWRLPADGEPAEGRVFSEIAIARETPLSEVEITALLSSLNESLPAYHPRPFETAVGEFETQPYQFVGPLEEFPEVAPARYLLLTHWDSLAELETWLSSSATNVLRQAGDFSAEYYLPIYHAPGERERLTPDGFQRGWGTEAPVA